MKLLLRKMALTRSEHWRDTAVFVVALRLGRSKVLEHTHSQKYKAWC